MQVLIIKASPRLSAEDQAEFHRHIRQVIRNIYEHCAQVAEDYVAKQHDFENSLTAQEVFDGVAEQFRQIADERKDFRVVVA